MEQPNCESRAHDLLVQYFHLSSLLLAKTLAFNQIPISFLAHMSLAATEYSYYAKFKGE